MDINFNEITDMGDRPRFIHKPNPLVERAYQIFEFDHNQNDYAPVGEYILLNKDEPIDITDKKVMNLVTLLNGGKDLISLENLTNKRVLYTLVPEGENSDQTKIIFKDYDGTKVSEDNAVFTIRKGVFHGY